MRLEHCILCPEIHPKNEIKLRICSTCRDKIENGEEPTFSRYLTLNFSEYFDWEPLILANKHPQNAKPLSIRERVKYHSLSLNKFGNFK